MKKIVILLPQLSSYPIGGYKIIYDYANFLSEKNDVSIIHITDLKYANYKHNVWIRWLYVNALYHTEKWRWYPLQKKINVLIVKELSPQILDKNDLIIATFWGIARALMDFNVDKNKIIYFIQHFETWAGKYDEVISTYQYGFKNIVIASWLKDKINEVGGRVDGVIKNGINTKDFYITSKIETRKKLCFMYHEEKWKGTKEAVLALKKLKIKYPNINIVSFGAYKLSSNIPDWITYNYKPSKEKLREIYNESSIFISTSWYEGFGLTGPEAMACGCALVTTDNGGSHDYAVDGQTALVVKPKDVDAIVAAVSYLIENEHIRINLAYNGEKYVRNNLNIDIARKKICGLIGEN